MAVLCPDVVVIVVVGMAVVSIVWGSKVSGIVVGSGGISFWSALVAL